MPLDLTTETTDSIGIDELVEHLIEQKIQPSEEASLASVSPMLARLARNRTFLAEAICNELKDYRHLQSSNSYSAQVFMLTPPRLSRQSFFIRACFWPSLSDHAVRTSGTAPFFYHHPHDHNFNFLTVGYHGPGYGSEYYEYEYDQCKGVRGEDVNLKFIENSCLNEGRILLYRAFTDIHNQLPADSFSVSINIMENSIRASVMDQYAFDLKARKISGLLNRSSATSLFNVAAALDDTQNDDVLRTIATRHPIDRVRLAAIEALASAACSPEKAIEIWALIGTSTSAFMRSWRCLRTKELEDLA